MPYHVHGGTPFCHGQVDLARKVVKMSNQAGHDLCQARVSIGAGSGDDLLGEVRVVLKRLRLLTVSPLLPGRRPESEVWYHLPHYERLKVDRIRKCRLLRRVMAV